MNRPQGDKRAHATATRRLRGAALPALAALACSACVAWPPAYPGYDAGTGYGHGYGYPAAFGYYDTSPLWAPDFGGSYLHIRRYHDPRRHRDPPARTHRPQPWHETHGWSGTRPAPYRQGDRHRGKHAHGAWDNRRTGHGGQWQQHGQPRGNPRHFRSGTDRPYRNPAWRDRKRTRYP